MSVRGKHNISLVEYLRGMVATVMIEVGKEAYSSHALFPLFPSSESLPNKYYNLDVSQFHNHKIKQKNQRLPVVGPNRDIIVNP